MASPACTWSSAPAAKYCAFFCEENVWHLAMHSALYVDGVAVDASHRRAVFITNAEASVCMWGQRAGEPVVWDYHVVLLALVDARWLVIDQDSTLASPLALAAWLDASFGPAQPSATSFSSEFVPQFRVVTVEALRATFASDRSHMLNGAAPPAPPWPAIRCDSATMTLPRYLDVRDDIAGRWLTRAALVSAYGDGAMNKSSA